ncbi:MAG: family 16 glycoside hydrolase [Limisphaerales bacterium]
MSPQEFPRAVWLGLHALAFFSGSLAVFSATPITSCETLVLFNGKDLSNFTTWETVHGREDPDRVFSVVDQIDGAPAIRLSGQHHGGILTKERYTNYRLIVEFRWGGVTWGPRKNGARDNGILLHCQGEESKEDGNPSRVGEQVAEAVVHTLDSAQTHLASLWHDEPAVLVTASMTCGSVRDATPDLAETRRRVRDRVGIFVLYVQEAHPECEASPYNPNQPPLPLKEKGGHRQPRDQPERLDFARDFSRTYPTVAQIVVDSMDNTAWVVSDKGQELKLLVGAGGKLLFKQGWLNSDRLPVAGADHLGKNPATL